MESATAREILLKLLSKPNLDREGKSVIKFTCQIFIFFVVALIYTFMPADLPTTSLMSQPVEEHKKKKTASEPW